MGLFAIAHHDWVAGRFRQMDTSVAPDRRPRGTNWNGVYLSEPGQTHCTGS